MPQLLVAERDFVVADQEKFSGLSGDINPFHMDPVAARRMMSGLPVVHGVHNLLWSLDSLFRHLPELPAIASIEVTFNNAVLVGDHVQLFLLQQDGKRLKASARVDAVRVMSLTINFGATGPCDPASGGPEIMPAKPIHLPYEQMPEQNGAIPFSVVAAGDASRLFPVAVSVLGLQRIVALASSSYLVGMVCPGLHSIFRGLRFTATAPMPSGDTALRFSVAETDDRFRLVRLSVGGGGWAGTIDTNVRPEPVSQLGLAAIADKVAPGEFSGSSVLIIGGSRGLGELIAKIAAAGGAQVTITYAVGEADARRVQAEMESHNLSCDIMRYDVRANPIEQLASLKNFPTQLYYLATPTIFKRQNSVFSQAYFDEFIDFYVTGFYNICRDLRAISKTNIAIFYPSSVSVDERPVGMTEYTMAKAAGEVLCADMQSFERPGPIIVKRLPRLATDQTATLLEYEQAEAIDVMLPIVREVYASSMAS